MYKQTKKLKKLILQNTFFSGESAVGKSSLVLRFVKGQFHEFQADSHIQSKYTLSPV